MTSDDYINLFVGVCLAMCLVYAFINWMTGEPKALVRRRD